MATTLKDKKTSVTKKLHSTGSAKKPRTAAYSAVVVVDTNTRTITPKSVKLIGRLSSPKKYSKSYRHIAGRGVKIAFHYPAHCDVEELADGIVISYLPLDIHCFGINEKEAVAGFAEDLEHLYTHYGKQKNDNGLTSRAKKIKYLTLSLVKEVSYTSVKQQSKPDVSVDIQEDKKVVNPLFHLIEPYLGVVKGHKNLSTMKL